MFSKQVWHDRRHQAEVFVNEEGVVSGAIVSFRKAVSLINPRPEILVALYQEAKIKRILGINAIILTSSSPEFVRGLCTFLGYSRNLKRKKTLQVFVLNNGATSPMFVNSCCAQLMGRRGQFDLEMEILEAGEELPVGDGTLRFERIEGVGFPVGYFLRIATPQKVIHFYDESITEELQTYSVTAKDRPDLAIRAVQIPEFGKALVSREKTLHVGPR